VRFANLRACYQYCYICFKRNKDCSHEYQAWCRTIHLRTFLIQNGQRIPTPPHYHPKTKRLSLSFSIQSRHSAFPSNDQIIGCCEVISTSLDGQVSRTHLLPGQYPHDCRRFLFIFEHTVQISVAQSRVITSPIHY
jgi:hypothetical protein